MPIIYSSLFSGPSFSTLEGIYISQEYHQLCTSEKLPGKDFETVDLILQPIGIEEIHRLLVPEDEAYQLEAEENLLGDYSSTACLKSHHSVMARAAS